jgi:hypothetical protein
MASMAVTASMARESRIGLPALIDSSSASLAPFASTSWASFIKDFARAAPVLFFQAGKAASAARTARSMSSSSHSAR